MEGNKVFNEEAILQRLKHYLPHQAPLKDFVHHNTLGAFQELHFEEAISRASKIFGYKTSLNLNEYRDLYKQHLIREDVLERVIIKRKGEANADEWIHNLFHKAYDISIHSRIGYFRDWWKKTYKVDLEHEINNLLFRLLGGYLDQGIALWHFPFDERGFLASVRGLEDKSLADFVRTKLGMQLLTDENITIKDLLDRLVGDEKLYENYLFEQQFSHPGWSGMVVMVEKQPQSLLDPRPISLSDLIKFELILEIDAIEYHHKNKWKPLGEHNLGDIPYLFASTPRTVEDDAIAIWQEAYEWSYYDSVLAGIQKMKGKSHRKPNKSFQALFCIDDREGSIRRYVEKFDPNCETYGTPGHFGIPMYYQPQNSLFQTKVCPGSVTPRHLVKEIGETEKIKKEIHFSRYSNHPIFGFVYSLVVGFWSGLMMFFNIFKPSFSTMATSSFSHMGKKSQLSIEHKQGDIDEKTGLQIGFTVEEMTSIVSSVLRSIGLVEGFGKVIYAIGHGSSSINNPYYAAYDCAACSGRPGSVNARVFAAIANHKEVRIGLREKGIDIPDYTQFVGGLHDTSRDEVEFYDEDVLRTFNAEFHAKNLEVFKNALSMNAKERSRRFFSINSKQSANKIHQLVKNRTISLFETRAELGHSTNALCFVGRHSLHEGLFLDRRAFSNSYDYSLDLKGELLSNILNAVVPVCGSVLDYFFARVDNQKLGSGSKLPHNVVGLIGVSNGVEGDLRPGLPFQMIDVHDPIRLLMIVEHYPEVVLETIKKNASTYQWFKNQWVILSVVHPETYEVYRFEKEELIPYQPLKKLLDTVEDVDALVESHDKNFPVYLIKKA